MKINRVSYYALIASVFAVSCSKEAAEPDVFDWADGNIYFRPTVTDVAGSRGQDMTLERLESFQVTCFNTADNYKDQAGYLSPYFENVSFIRSAGNNLTATYTTPPGEAPWGWPSDNALMRFFAFSPSLSEMAEGMDGSGLFSLINTTVKTGDSVFVDYRLGNVRINPDISRQVDFLTAYAAGERWKDFTGGVELGFGHQFCQVELRAWGDGSACDFEIAGVRLGNPVVEGDFIFADDASSGLICQWAKPQVPVYDKVEYIYRSSGDRIYKINKSEHNIAESATSIMGRGGCAMVVPTVNAKWEGLGDPDIKNVPYSTDRMYFSILTRVTDSNNGDVIYPYPDDKSGMTVVTFAIDGSGTILSRLYAGARQGQYFLDPDLQLPFVSAPGVEIKDYGWAAVPVDVDWKAGKRYIYTLNYSEGIGLHIPEDPEPGKPIAGKSTDISWGLSVGEWSYAEKDENYDPDLEVPGIDE